MKGELCKLSQFIFNIIVDMVRFKSTLLLFSFCLSPLSFVPPFQPFAMADKVGKNPIII